MRKYVAGTSKTLCGLLLVWALLAACTAAPDGGRSAADSENGGASGDAGGETLPVRWVLPGTAPEDQKTVEEAINEKLQQDGLRLRYEAIYIPWDVWDQKTNLMMSTGEAFELIHIMHDLKAPNIIAGNGGIIPIDELLDEYGADLKQSIPDWIWDSAVIDGSTYFVPAFWLDTAQNAGGNGTITLRKDLLEANGLEPPKSPEELLSIAETLQNNWQGESQKVYAMLLHEETPIYLHETYDTFPFTVFENLIYISQDGEVKSWLETEEFKRDAAFFREAYTRGLINPDALTEPKEVEARNAEFGKYLFREGDGLGGWSMVQRNVPGAALDNYNLTDRDISFRPFGVRNSNGVSATTQHPEAAIQFLNWMYGNQENFDLVMYGIKDVHWADLGPNKMETLKLTEQGAMAYQLPYWMAGNVPMGRWTEETHPTYLKTQTEIVADAVNSITIGFNFDPSPVAAEYSNVLAEYRASIFPIRLGLVDFEESYPPAMKRMEAAGLQIVVAEYEKQFAAWLDSRP